MVCTAAQWQSGKCRAGALPTVSITRRSVQGDQTAVLQVEEIVAPRFVNAPPVLAHDGAVATPRCPARRPPLEFVISQHLWPVVVRLSYPMTAALCILEHDHRPHLLLIEPDASRCGWPGGRFAPCIPSINRTNVLVKRAAAGARRESRRPSKLVPARCA